MGKIPDFQSLEEASEFWDTHSITDYLDDLVDVDVEAEFGRPERVPVAVYLAPEAVTQLEAVAKRRGMDYQTMLRVWLMERLAAQPSLEAVGVNEPVGAYHAETR